MKEVGGLDGRVEEGLLVKTKDDRALFVHGRMLYSRRNL